MVNITHQIYVTVEPGHQVAVGTLAKTFVITMDQCDSLITKFINMLLDWYSGDIYVTEGALRLRVGLF